MHCHFYRDFLEEIQLQQNEDLENEFMVEDWPTTAFEEGIFLDCETDFAKGQAVKGIYIPQIVNIAVETSYSEWRLEPKEEDHGFHQYLPAVRPVQDSNC